MKKLIIFLYTFAASYALAKAPEFVANEYVLKLTDSIQNVRSNLVLKNAKSITKDGKVVLIKYTGKKSDLQKIPGVLVVDRNFIYRANATPNDERYKEMWGLNNIGQDVKFDKWYIKGVPGMDVGAEKAWNISTGSKEMIVAVIDTGVDYTIPDLKDNAWTNQKELNGQKDIDDDGNGYVDDIYGYDFANGDSDPKDDNGHGSHVAGTIGAKGNNKLGVTGINWNVSIMAIKFLKANGSGTLAGAVEAIDYAISNGAKVLNNSWGGSGFSQNLFDSVVRSKDKGSLFVVAAGNSNFNNNVNPAYPANFNIDNVISVAAIDPTGKRAFFSNFGSKRVHLAAPGLSILSTVRGFEYESYSGTSMAAPHVSGVAALVWSFDRSLDYLKVKQRLFDTVKKNSDLEGEVSTGGIVNAFRALTNKVN